MPELPEVECMARHAHMRLKSRRVLRVWCDKALVRTPKNLEEKLKGASIEGVSRKGKYLKFELSLTGKKSFLVIHPRMTGHLLFGKWESGKSGWVSKISGPLSEKVNGYIRFLLVFDNGLMMALSDTRRFASVFWGDEKTTNEKLSYLGPDALSIKPEEFFKRIRGRNISVKQVLLDQNIVSGIGNIYADEILWDTKTDPSKPGKNLSMEDVKKIIKSARKILPIAILAGGSSIRNFRDGDGRPGSYSSIRSVYARKGEACRRCKTIIKRMVLGGRSTHFCPKCQSARH
jgi:formamidopyrimidine-DNA glycosylase